MQEAPAEVEVTYCSICYIFPIVEEGKPIPEGDKGTVEFECGHRFCEECTIEQLKQYIERAEISKIKCFEHECQKPISDERIKEILSVREMGDLVSKYDRFKD